CSRAGRPGGGANQKVNGIQLVAPYHLWLGATYRSLPGDPAADLREVLPRRPLRLREQLAQVLLPGHRPGVRPVSVRLVARRDEHEPTLLDAPDLALGNSQLRGVDEVIRRVDVQEWGADLLEPGRGIVVT